MSEWTRDMDRKMTLAVDTLDLIGYRNRRGILAIQYGDSNLVLPNGRSMPANHAWEEDEDEVDADELTDAQIKAVNAMCAADEARIQAAADKAAAEAAQKEQDRKDSLILEAMRCLTTYRDPEYVLRNHPEGADLISADRAYAEKLWADDVEWRRVERQFNTVLREFKKLLR